MVRTCSEIFIFDPIRRDTHLAVAISRSCTKTLAPFVWFNCANNCFPSYLVAGLEAGSLSKIFDNAAIVQRVDRLRQQKTGVLRGHLESCVAILILAISSLFRYLAIL